MFILPDHPAMQNHPYIHSADPSSLLPTPESSWPVTPTAELSLFHPHDTSPVPLILMLEHFPEIPSILGHPQFTTLVRLWSRFQLNISLSRTAEYRSCIHEDLSYIAIQCDAVIQLLLSSRSGSLAYPDPPNEHDQANSEADSNLAITAFGRLKERVEMLQLVLQVIENGRVWFGQDPKEALLPILESHTVALERQQQQVDPSCLTCAFVEPSTVVIKNEQLQQEQYPQVPWSIPVAAAMAGPSEAPPVRQDQAILDNRINPDEDKGEAMSMQETDDSQSPMESPCDDDTDFEPMDEEDTNDDDDDEYTETKRHSRNIRRGTTQPQHQSRPSKKDVKRTYSDGDDTLISHTEEKILTDRRPVRVPRQHTRRTATSYDAETTHYLKSVFFSIYSKRDKLTKEQRRQVQVHTGLKPRNITYWFSNHKRRFQRALKVYKQTVQKTRGAVKSYDDFLLWRRHRGLTDEVLDDEEEEEAGEANEFMASPITSQIATDRNGSPSSP